MKAHAANAERMVMTTRRFFLGFPVPRQRGISSSRRRPSSSGEPESRRRTHGYGPDRQDGAGHWFDARYRACDRHRARADGGGGDRQRARQGGGR